MSRRLAPRISLGAVVVLIGAVLVSPATARDVLAKRVIQGDTLYQVLPRDAFEALVDPEGVPVSAADTLAHPDEPFLGVVINGEAKAYSTWLLESHEIVNDDVGEVAIAACW